MKKKETVSEIVNRLVSDGKLSNADLLDILSLDPVSQLTALSLADKG